MSKKLIRSMEACGWTGRRTSKGHWIGKAPDGYTITVPPKMSRGNRTAQNCEAQFARWLRRQAPEEIAAIEGTDLIEDPILAETVRNKAVQKATDALLKKAPVDPLKQFEHDMEVLTTAITGPKPETRELVSTRPWLARKKHGPIGGERYESEAVVENRYSDGSVEYVCAFGCGYSNPNPKGVAVHYGRSHTMKGEVAPAGEGPRHVDVTYTEPSFHRAYNPQERLVKALTSWLEENWTAELDMDEVATMFLTWAHERPDLEHVERDVTAYTDEEMVQRIRAIVGQPFSVELKDATAENDALKALVEQRTIERDEVTAQLAKVQRDLDAIRDMLGGIGH
jgi:predicted RNA binding protein YcfA (HicA-like mRNA interferase family)